MEEYQLREELLAQADSAFLVLTTQVNELFDLAHEYAEDNQTKTMSTDIKMSDLRKAVTDMARYITFCAHLVEGWKNEMPHVITKRGIEVEYLNELQTTINATYLFFERENLDISRLSMGAVNQAYSDLVRCNRLL